MCIKLKIAHAPKTHLKTLAWCVKEGLLIRRSSFHVRVCIQHLEIMTFFHTPPIRPGALGGGEALHTPRVRLHVRARILNQGVRVPISKHRKYDRTFERIISILVFVVPW